MVTSAKSPHRGTRGLPGQGTVFSTTCTKEVNKERIKSNKNPFSTSSFLNEYPELLKKLEEHEISDFICRIILLCN